MTSAEMLFFNDLFAIPVKAFLLEFVSSAELHSLPELCRLKSGRIQAFISTGFNASFSAGFNIDDQFWLKAGVDPRTDRKIRCLPGLRCQRESPSSVLKCD